jgi:hypothetical protein
LPVGAGPGCGALRDGDPRCLGLGHPGRADPMGRKGDVDLQGLPVVGFSTCHDGLLAGVASRGLGVPLPGAAPPAIPRHSQGVGVRVECVSRTLAEVLQLCRKCKRPPLGRPCPCRCKAVARQGTRFEIPIDAWHPPSIGSSALAQVHPLGVIPPVEDLCPLQGHHPVVAVRQGRLSPGHRLGRHPSR